MKSKRVIILERILRILARSVLRIKKPVIVGITGSVGKTSTKEAVYTVLASRFRVRMSDRNYNNEIGIPLTVIGTKGGGSSLLGWIRVCFAWLGAMVSLRDYPEILVLEMGVDRPGDMDYLLSFVSPSVSIVTNISGSHLEFFEDLDHIAREKGGIIHSLAKTGTAILNVDDVRVERMKASSNSALLTYGITKSADVTAEGVKFAYEGTEVNGLTFKLNYSGTSIPVRLRHILAKHQVYSALAAAAVGIHFRINLVEIATSLERFFSPPGRMNKIEGIRGSVIIDDTYNASPVSTVAALDALQEIDARRKIAVLGDMLELGIGEEEGHRSVGKKVTATGVELFFAVGERMEYAVAEARKAGLAPENIYYFDNPSLAAVRLTEVVRPGDLILVKGSQGMRMEKVVERIMQHPERAHQLLCRQTPDWKDRPFINPARIQS